jgi:hypothetical protein
MFESSLKACSRGFSEIEDGLSIGQQCTLVVCFNLSDSSIFIERTAVIPDSHSSTASTSIPYGTFLSELYLSVSDHAPSLSRASTALYFTDDLVPSTPSNSKLVQLPSNNLEQMQHSLNISSSTPSDAVINNHPVYIQTKKKYKPVAQKV